MIELNFNLKTATIIFHNGKNIQEVIHSKKNIKIDMRLLFSLDCSSWFISFILIIAQYILNKTSNEWLFKKMEHDRGENKKKNLLCDNVADSCDNPLPF